MKILLLTLVLLTPAQDGKLQIKYERIEDRTNVSTPAKWIKGTTLSIQAYLNHSGKSLESPAEAVGLVFYSSSSNWKYLSAADSRLFVLTDKERFSLDIPSRKSEITSSRRPYSRVGVSERLIFKLTLENLKRITQASKVEMKLGDQTFTLGADTLADLRELLAYASH